MPDQFRQTPDLSGEIHPDRANEFDQIQNMIASDQTSEDQGSPLDGDNPWDHIWLPLDERMGDSDRAQNANMEGFTYFLGHNSIINMITDEYGFSWLGIMKMSWLKDRKDFLPSSLDEVDEIPFDNDTSGS